MSITEFLEARIAEDEEVATRAAGGSNGRWSRASKQVAYCLEDQHHSPCSTLHALAVAYSGHPDCRQEWSA